MRKYDYALMVDGKIIAETNDGEFAGIMFRQACDRVYWRTYDIRLIEHVLTAKGAYDDALFSRDGVK